MFVQILPTSTIRNIRRTLRRTRILILGLKGLIIIIIIIIIIIPFKAYLFIHQ